MFGAFQLIRLKLDDQGDLMVITGLGLYSQFYFLLVSLISSWRSVGKTGLEPVRLTAQNPKSCASANSATSPELEDYKRKGGGRQ
jgi:hypothetical protein